MSNVRIRLHGSEEKELPKFRNSDTMTEVLVISSNPNYFFSKIIKTLSNTKTNNKGMNENWRTKNINSILVPLCQECVSTIMNRTMLHRSLFILWIALRVIVTEPNEDAHTDSLSNSNITTGKIEINTNSNVSTCDDSMVKIDNSSSLKK